MFIPIFLILCFHSCMCVRSLHPLNRCALSEVGVVQELERRGARVACTYTGGLDFSVPVQEIRVKWTFRGRFRALGSRV